MTDFETGRLFGLLSNLDTRLRRIEGSMSQAAEVLKNRVTELAQVTGRVVEVVKRLKEAATVPTEISDGELNELTDRLTAIQAQLEGATQ